MSENQSIESSYHLPSLFTASGLTSLLLLGVFGVSLLIRSNDFFYVPNAYTFGILIPTYLLVLIAVIITISIFYFDLFKHHLIPTVLFLAGGWSNVLEKLIFGSVTDYIRFLDGYINIADIMIWTGLIWLNILIWFAPKKWSNQPKKS
jgi:lipoprotein signal peptidase